MAGLPDVEAGVAPGETAQTVTAPNDPPRRTRVQVGKRRNGGTRVASVRGDRIAVTAAYMAGIQVELTADDMREFAYGVLQMLGDIPTRDWP